MATKEVAANTEGATDIKNKLRRTDEDRIKEAKEVKLTPVQEENALRLTKKGVFKNLEDARFCEQISVVYEREAEPMIKAIRDSETLTGDDYSIIVT
jgi:hypothetical protein